MCEVCGGFLTKRATGQVPPWTDQRAPYGCWYWTCKKCGNQTTLDKPKPVEPEPDNWRTIPI